MFNYFITYLFFIMINAQDRYKYVRNDSGLTKGYLFGYSNLTQSVAGAILGYLASFAKMSLVISGFFTYQISQNKNPSFTTFIFLYPLNNLIEAIDTLYIALNRKEYVLLNWAFINFGLVLADFFAFIGYIIDNPLPLIPIFAIALIVLTLVIVQVCWQLKTDEYPVQDFWIKKVTDNLALFILGFIAWLVLRLLIYLKLMGVIKSWSVTIFPLTIAFLIIFICYVVNILMKISVQRGRPSANIPKLFDSIFYLCLIGILFNLVDYFQTRDYEASQVILSCIALGCIAFSFLTWIYLILDDDHIFWILDFGSMQVTYKKVLISDIDESQGKKSAANRTTKVTGTVRNFFKDLKIDMASNQKTKKLDNKITTFRSTENLLCFKCLTNRPEILFEPCKHGGVCKSCFDQFSENHTKICPVCTGHL